MATVQTLKFRQRQARPYPPGNVRVNGKLTTTLPALTEPGLTLSWSHRDRLLQADNLVSHSEADTGQKPERNTESRYYRGRGLFARLSPVKQAGAGLTRWQ